MPIYAYKCESCGFAKDVLQKMSDALLTDCPTCGAARFQKQVTAAGFQLKGSGWYATDFKGGPAAAAPSGEAAAPASSASTDASAASATTTSSTTATPSAPAPAKASAEPPSAA